MSRKVIGIFMGLLFLAGGALLAQNGQIKGKITRSNGQACNGAIISVYDLGQTLVRSSTCAEDGTYTVAGVPAGTYTRYSHSRRR